MGLFNLFGKKIHTSTSTSMNKLGPDGELPFGWAYANKEFIARAEAEYKVFWNQYCNNLYGEPKKKYAALKSLLQYIADAKRLYERMGECYLFWFENWWAKEEEVQRLTNELHYIEKNIDELEERYKRTQYIENILIPELKRKALDIVKTNPGILQTDAYSHFDPDVKQYVQDAFRALDKEGKIKREKQGRTFKLTT